MLIWLPRLRRRPWSTPGKKPPGMLPSRRQKLCAALLLLLLLLSPSVGLAKGKKKPRTPPVDVRQQISKLLDGQRDGLQGCVVEKALLDGNKRAELLASLMINNSGQLVTCDLKVNLDKGDPKPTHDCVEKLLRAVPFPRSTNPLITIERRWMFSLPD